MNLFQSSDSVIQSRSYGYAPSFRNHNPRKIFLLQISATISIQLLKMLYLRNWEGTSSRATEVTNKF